MIPFEMIDPARREEFNALLLKNNKGCEYGFTSICIWGRQQAAFVDGFLVLFSQFDRKAVYPYPVGQGDVRPVLDAIIHDAKMRGIPCCITGLSEANAAMLDRLYPGKFRIYFDRNNFDYVYNIDDLADLKGRKFQKKRNHLNRFRALYPNWRTEALTPANVEAVRQIAAQWYRSRIEQDPTADYHLEQRALRRALERYEALGLEGMVLYDGERPVAFSIASQLSEDTMDVHFEKACEDVDGAYPAINQAFAQYLRDKYLSIRYLNREEDMGIEGLRKAKLSYCPHHMQEKYWARLWEESDEH